MSHCRKLGVNGKDLVIFATKEDHAVPSKIQLPQPDPQPGLILPSGDINWNCPCLGGMATGPCGVEFRNAFSCFHYSKAEPKGSDCFDKFKIMQTCMTKFPTLYNRELNDDDEIASMSEAEQNAERDLQNIEKEVSSPSSNKSE
ncbi:mitochondrial intermembrane space import and assembly protein 40-B [Rhynchophorus ferrugineus]|uniref:mitochondrial intermembrane space import and assembly protein 40-B n=1 Tax=Rhynchophorus ferrugineus TaxID=354439 RepID=UPI003FCCAEE1